MDDNMFLSKVGDCSRGWPEGSIFNSYYTEMEGRALLLSLDCSILPLIRTLYYWVLGKEVSSTIFRVFGMIRTGIEPRSLGPLANTLPMRPMSQLWYISTAVAVVSWFHSASTDFSDSLSPFIFIIDHFRLAL